MVAKFFDYVTQWFIFDVFRKCSLGYVSTEFEKYKYNGSYEELKKLDFDDEHLFLFASDVIEFYCANRYMFFRLSSFDNVLEKEIFFYSTLYIIPLPQPIGVHVKNKIDVSAIESSFEYIFGNYANLYAINHERRVYAYLLSKFAVYCYDISRMQKKDSVSICKLILRYVGPNYLNRSAYEDEIDEINFILQSVYPATRVYCYDALFELFENLKNFDVNLIDVILRYSHKSNYYY